MSWAAHEFEAYVLHKHFKVRASFTGILVGCLLPDLFTKLPVYGFSLGSLGITRVAQPWMYHRGWPGVGPTHSLLFVAVVAMVVLGLTRHRALALGVLIGGWAHVLTDCFDSVGTMLFFPFSTDHYSFGMWAYASQEGRYGDASAYYSSLGGLWDAFWLVVCLANFRLFSRGYFEKHVVRNDPAWPYLQRRFSLRSDTLCTMYRAYFVYGAARVVGWMIWARGVNPLRATESVDFTWGGPGWVETAPAFQRASGWKEMLTHLGVGLTATVSCLAVLWFVVGRWLWGRASASLSPGLAEDGIPTLQTSRSTTTGQ